MTRTRDFLAGALALCGFGAATAADVAGYAIEVQGRWLMAGAPVSVGMALPPGARVAPAPGLSGGRLVVVDARDAAILTVRHCEPGRSCTAVVLPPMPSAATPDAMLSRLFARLGGDPDRYVATITRGPASLPPAVLPVVDGAVDLEPVLGNLRDGAELVLQPLVPCGVNCASQLRQHRVASNRALRIDDLLPGLYELILRQPAGTLGPAQRRGWLLLTTPARLQETRNELAAIVQRTQSWGDSVDRGFREGFIRAWLAQKAEP